MGSLNSCLKKTGKLVSREDGSKIRAIRRQMIHEGMVPEEASIRAVQEFSHGLRVERSELIDRIEGLGGDVSGIDRPALFSDEEGSPVSRAVPASTKAGKPLNTINLSREFEVEETGEVVRVEQRADRMVRQLKKRMSVVRQLGACVSG